MKKIVSCILVLCISLSAIFLTITFLLRFNLQEARVVSYVKNADLTFILKTKDGKSNNLLDDTTEFLKLIGIPESTISEVVNSEPTKEFVGKYTYKLLYYMIYKKGNIFIEKDDILSLVKENFEIIETSLKKHNLTFTKSQQNTIISLVEKYSGEIMELFPTANNLLKKINEDSLVLYNGITIRQIADILSTFTSKTLVYSLVIILFFSVILLILIYWKSFESIYFIRASIFLYTFVFLGVEIIFGTLVKDVLMSGWESANTFMNYLVNVISKSLWVFLLISFLLLIGLTIILRRKEESQVISQESAETLDISE